MKLVGGARITWSACRIVATTISFVTPGEWLSFRRFTSKLSWSHDEGEKMKF